MIAKDSSNNNFQLKVFGNAQISTSVKKFGTGSALFDGAGDYIRGNFTLNYSSDFTIECWLYRTGSGSVLTIFEAGNIQSGQGGVHLYIDGNNQIVWNNGFTYDLAGGIAPLNQWIHVAAVRHNGTNTLYVDGISVDSGNQTYPVNNDIITIGGAPNYGFYFPGYIDDFRITSGIARYTSNFIPPTAELIDPFDPYIDNVSLLLHGDGSDNSLVITDSSNNNFAVTLNGGTKISQTEKKFGTGSIVFDGSADYLQLGTTSAITALQFPDDLTVEMWYYPLSLSTDQCLYDASLPNQESTRADAFAIAVASNGQMYLFHNGTPYYTSSHPTINAWNHIAVSRSGSDLRVFLNGNVVLTLTNSVNFSRGGALISTITETLGSYTINGYIDELRVTKGVARYTSNFIPPTAPFSNRIVSDTVPTAGLVARFMADQGITESGGIITSWVDQSGNSIVATPFGNPTRIANQMNGRPAVSFNDTQYFSFNLNATIVEPRTYVILGRYRDPTTTGQQGFLAAGFNNSYDRGYVFKNGGEDRAYFYNGAQIRSPNITLTKYHVATVVHNGILGYNNYRMNGNNSTEISYGNLSVGDVNQFVIGGRLLGSERMRGEIVEILIYNRQLSMIEIEQIEKYAKV